MANYADIQVEQFDSCKGCMAIDPKRYKNGMPRCKLGFVQELQEYEDYKGATYYPRPVYPCLKLTEGAIEYKQREYLVNSGKIRPQTSKAW
jgi:hypothetical protein